MAILLAGIAAGGINVVVGSGTLITFPTLLALGVPPVVANVSNNIGLVPGSVTGAVGYRRELADQKGRVVRLALASALGGTVGAVLLLVLPQDAFAAIVPVLVALAVVLVLVQPAVSRRVAARRERVAARQDGEQSDRDAVPTWAWLAGLLTGVYGGYFGAAQGVLLMGLLGLGLEADLQRLNAVKNVMAGTVNAVAAVVFIAVADVDWRIVALIAVGATLGGLLGARLGRRLPPSVLRAVIVVVGTVAFVALVAG